MKYNKKKICQTANTLRKRGYTLSQAFVLAWSIAKGATVKVAGTSKLNRQEALRRLTMYKPSETQFTLIRESDNVYDENAIAVMVSVRDSRQYCIGYIEANTEDKANVMNTINCVCYMTEYIEMQAEKLLAISGDTQ